MLPRKIVPSSSLQNVLNKFRERNINSIKRRFEEPTELHSLDLINIEEEKAPSLVSMNESEAMSLNEEKSINVAETEVSDNVNTINLDEPIPVKKRRTRKKPVKETITQSEYYGPDQTQEEIDQSQNKALGIVAGGIAASVAVSALANPSTDDSAPNNAPHLDIPEEL